MKILSITAGAAGMYCGSCARDNALAVELVRRGHDVTLMPVYTPTRTDERNVSRDRVLFGGLNVYLQQRFPMFRRVPRFVDRWLDSPALIRAMSGRSVKTDPAMLGDLMVSMLHGEHGVLRREFDKLVEWMRGEPPPDVINLPNSLLIAMARPLRESTGRPICCTLQGEELFLDGLQPSYRSQAIQLIKEQISSVDRFIAVSEYCAQFMASYLSIPRERIAVVPLGIRFDGYARRESARPATSIGYFARISQEKGLHVLADAYIRLRRRMGTAIPRLEAAGYLSPADAPYLERVRHRLSDAGCAGAFTYRGELDRDGKLAFLRGLDVLSVPATYDEPKGMFILEAMAGGVPVVQPRRGSFTEMVENTGGGLLVAPDDPEALAEGLYRIINDQPLASELGRRAYDGVRAQYSIERSADRLLSVYESVLGGPGLQETPSC